MRRLIITFIVAIGASSLVACGGEEQLPTSELPPVSVQTVKAKMQALADGLTYVGTVQPIDRVRLSTKIMGWIDRINFTEGDIVPKGAVLVNLRSQEIQAKQAQVEAAITEAEIHFKNAETNLQRIESLFSQKAATQKELDDTRAAFVSAKARRNTASEAKKEVDELLAYTELRAPFDGVVSRKMANVGDMANPGQPVIEVENVSKVKIVAKIPESDVRNLQVGSQAQVFIEAAQMDGNNISNKIDKIVPAGDPASRQFDIHIVMGNSSGFIKSGMFARVSTGGSSTMTLVVPQKAVFRRGQLEGLFVVDSENKAHLRWVRTGSKQQGMIEILSGLNPGERVVVESETKLLDGQPVEVK